MVDNNGAPQGPKTFVFYNPPVVNKELGIRRSALLEATDLASQLLANDIQTVVFGRTRQTVEVLLTYLQEAAARFGRGRIQDPKTRSAATGAATCPTSGERSSGACATAPSHCRQHQRPGAGRRHRRARGCVLVGYPGTVASMWQQAGRAGRRNTQSLAVMVAGSSPLDQFVVNNPEYFFERSPENGLINPANLFILMSHLQCAAFELPFRDGEGFGDHNPTEIVRNALFP